MTSELRRVNARFSDDNPLLHLSLGMISACRTLDALLSTHARPPEQTADQDQDEPGVDFVLGLIAFRRRLLSTVDHAAGVGASCSVHDEETSSFVAGDGANSPGRSLWR